MQKENCKFHLQTSSPAQTPPRQPHTRSRAGSGRPAVGTAMGLIVTSPRELHPSGTVTYVILFGFPQFSSEEFKAGIVISSCTRTRARFAYGVVGSESGDVCPSVTSAPFLSLITPRHWPPQEVFSVRGKTADSCHPLPSVGNLPNCDSPSPEPGAYEKHFTTKLL